MGSSNRFFIIVEQKISELFKAHDDKKIDIYIQISALLQDYRTRMEDAGKWNAYMGEKFSDLITMCSCIAGLNNMKIPSDECYQHGLKALTGLSIEDKKLG